MSGLLVVFVLDEQVQRSAPHVVVLLLRSNKPARSFDYLCGLDVLVLRRVRCADVGALALSIWQLFGDENAAVGVPSRVACG